VIAVLITLCIIVVVGRSRTHDELILLNTRSVRVAAPTELQNQPRYSLGVSFPANANASCVVYTKNNTDPAANLQGAQLYSGPVIVEDSATLSAFAACISVNEGVEIFRQSETVKITSEANSGADDYLAIGLASTPREGAEKMLRLFENAHRGETSAAGPNVCRQAVLCAIAVALFRCWPSPVHFCAHAGAQ